MRNVIAALALYALLVTYAFANNGPYTGGGPFGGNAPTSGSGTALSAMTTTNLGGAKLGSGLAISTTGVLSATGTGGGSISIPLGTGLTNAVGTQNGTPLTNTSTGLFVQTWPLSYTTSHLLNTTTDAGNLSALSSSTSAAFYIASTTTGVAYNIANVGAGALNLTMTGSGAIVGLPLVSGVAQIQTNGFSTCIPDGTNVNCFGLISPLASVTTVGAGLSIVSGALTASSTAGGTVTSIGIGTGGLSSTQSPLTTTGTMSILAATTTMPGSIVVGSGLAVSSTGVLSATGTGGGGAAFTPVLQPLSVTTTDTAGNAFPYTYFDGTTTGAAAIGAPSWGVAASLAANVSLRYRFKMPPTLPASGALNLCSLCQANASSGVVKYTITDADIAVNNTASVGATALSSETQTSITWSAVDNYVETCTPLTATPVANHVSAGAVTFNTSGWTLAQILSCNFTESWR